MDKSNQNAHRYTQNKGVNITSNEFPKIEERVSEETNTSGFPSLYNVKNQLQNAIDVMGPATPHLIYTTSSVDADNEESIISSTSIFSSVFQIKQPGKNKDQAVSTYENDTARDISEISTEESEILTAVHDYPIERTSQPICVPAVLPPAVLCMNPGCVCAHSATYASQMPVQPNYEDPSCYNKLQKIEKKHKFSTIFGKLTKTHKRMDATPAELYKMNVMQPRKDGSPPRRFVFDLIDEVPKPPVHTVGTNTQYFYPNKGSQQINTTTRKLSSSKDMATPHPSHYSGIVVTQTASNETGKLPDAVYYDNLANRSKLSYKTDQSTARVDVYYFDHGNAAYYRTTDSPPLIMTEIVAERTENYATKFWAEFFGSIYIAFAFFTTFILQFFRFTLHSFMRPLTIGLLQLVSDYFFKPFLAVVFNAIIQPPLIFFYNITTSLRDLCDPIAEGFGYFLREISALCKSIRLFEIRQDKHSTSDNNNNAKVKCECGRIHKHSNKSGI